MKVAIPTVQQRFLPDDHDGYQAVMQAADHIDWEGNSIEIEELIYDAFTKEKRQFNLAKAIKAGAHVVKQAIKIGIGVGMVPEEVQAEREAICLGCDYGKPCWPGAVEVCCGAISDAVTEGKTGTCGCVVGAKTKMADESCPYGKWKQWEEVDSVQ